jgi:hypothetical protein
MKMAGILGQYFAKPGSGILGGLFDYPTGPWPEDHSEQSAAETARTVAAWRNSNSALKPNALTSGSHFAAPSSIQMPPANPLFVPPQDVAQFQFVDPMRMNWQPQSKASSWGAGKSPVSNQATPSTAPLSPVPDSSTEPPSAATSNAAATDSDSSGDFLSRLGQGLRDNSSMLMALGAGTMTGGLGRGFQAAAAATEADAKRQAESASRNATLQALLQLGVPNAVAHAAAINPDLLKAISGRAFGQARESMKK